MLKWRPFRSTSTFARKLVLALASVARAMCIALAGRRAGLPSYMARAPGLTRRARVFLETRRAEGGAELS